MKKPFEILLFLVLTFAFSNSLFSSSLTKTSKNNSNYVSQFNHEIIDSTTVAKQQNILIENYNNIIISSSSSIYLEEKSEVLFKVYPNPATEKLFVQFVGWEGEKEIKLLDITGRIVLIQKSLEEKNEIDISSFPKGIYLISAKNKSSYVVKKIKIQ